MRLPLRRLTLAVAAVSLPLAVWAAASSSHPTATSAQNATVRIALDWTANVDYLGIYTAIEKGYFEDHGVTPKIIPFANTPAETLIKSGKTDLGISYPPDIIINRSQGLKYKAVGAIVANNTTALAVLADSKYKSPKDLNGTLYGGFGIQSDKPIISAILKAAGAGAPSFKQVVLNTDVVTALKKKRIAYTAVFGGIDDVTAELQGTKLRTFPYRKYLGAAGNYPNLAYVASDKTIASKGAALKGALAALAEGYEYSAKHPAEAEQILIDANKTALGKSEKIVKATGDKIAKQLVDGSGRWGRLQAADFTGLGRILKGGGIVKSVPKPADLYTNSLLPR